MVSILENDNVIVIPRTQHQKIILIQASLPFKVVHFTCNSHM